MTTAAIKQLTESFNYGLRITEARDRMRAAKQRASDAFIAGIRADTDEILNLLAIHLRGDLADVAECFDDHGKLDWKKAREAGISRVVKKYRQTRRPVRDKDAVIGYEVTTDIELYSSLEAAKQLADIYGMKQAPKTNDFDMAQIDDKSRATAASLFQELVEAYDGDAESAMLLMRENAPLLAQHVQKAVAKL